MENGSISLGDIMVFRNKKDVIQHVFNRFGIKIKIKPIINSSSAKFSYRFVMIVEKFP